MFPVEHNAVLMHKFDFLFLNSNSQNSNSKKSTSFVEIGPVIGNV